MEISTLATFLTPFLPYFLKLGKGADETETETAANQFGEAVWQKAQMVWAVLGSKVDAKASAKEAAADVVNEPEDEDSQAALRNQLKKLLANDEALANQLATIFQSDNSTSTTQITQTVKGNKTQTIGPISGGQVFGNVSGSVIISGSGNSVTSTSVSSTSAELTSPSASNPPVKTILVLAANPKDTNPLRLGEEVREIQAGLERSKYRDRFRIEQRWAVRPRDVQRALLDTSPQIVHFSGHGIGVASSSDAPDDSRKAVVISAETGAVQTGKPAPEGLLFEDVTGQSKLVSTEAIANLFSLFSDEVECVVLNACYSAAQADAIAQHIPYVVGMKKAIGDRAAIKFSLGFYDGLLAGRPVEFAYKLGCNAIELDNIPEQLTPVLKHK
ncbi:MAG: CHAT domain-containing protein [Phormidesmis sp.]